MIEKLIQEKEEIKKSPLYKAMFMEAYRHKYNKEYMIKYGDACLMTMYDHWGPLFDEGFEQLNFFLDSIITPDLLTLKLETLHALRKTKIYSEIEILARDHFWRQNDLKMYLKMCLNDIYFNLQD